MKPTLKYLLWLWLLLLIISLPASFFMSQAWYLTLPSTPKEHEYKGIAIIICLVVTLEIWACSVSIFLNLFKKIRSNAIYRLLSFYALPLVWLIIEQPPVSYAHIMLPPIFICLAVGYVLFSKWLSVNKKTVLL